MGDVTLYIAMSLDGFIAGPNNDLSFLNPMHMEGEDYGYSNFIQDVDAIIWGRKTYDHLLKMVPEFPFKNKKCFVLSTKNEGSDEHVTFVKPPLKPLIEQLQKETPGKIYCDGGAELVNQMLKESLFDEFIISIVPVLLGSGTRLFMNNNQQTSLKFISSQSFPSGLVQIKYKLIIIV